MLVRVPAAALVIAAALALVGPLACDFTPLSQTDSTYYDWDGQKVLCAAGLDPESGNSLDSVMGGLERAARQGEVLLLFAHTPGVTVPLDRLEAVLARARDLGLDFITARDIATGDGSPRAGLALCFDDSGVDQWYGARPLLDRYGARVTFFVTRFDRLSQNQRDELHALAGDGHDIEAHGLRHLVAPDYVEEFGLQAYLDDEALPSIELLRQDGFDPVAYAYPFGARTGEIDRAMLRHVQLLRSVTFTAPYPLVSDPCPR